MSAEKDAVWAFANHAASLKYEDIPDDAIKAGKTFLLDSMGVGVVGSAAPWVDELWSSQAAFGVDPARGSARVLASGRKLALPSAALANAFQIHNSEFDCVHEPAVVHPMAVLLGAMLSAADCDGYFEGEVSGKALLTALIAGVDIAAGLGVASNAPLKFFRPSTAGGFGAAAALARMKGMDTDGIVNSMSTAYAQMGGTMQAHTEGSMLLAMQVGFNARNAIVAAEMAAHGADGPKNILEGPFGYFALFECDHDVGAVAETLGKTWRITEVAHKPFPSGRATHGLVDGVLQLKQKHGFDAQDVARVEGYVPSLTHRLIGRPSMTGMTPGYARLSGQYVVASAILGDGVGVEDFKPDALNDDRRLALASMVHIHIDENPDPNALAPLQVAIILQDGRRLEVSLDKVYGAPANPMTHDAHLAKFQKNFASASPAVPAAQGEALIAAIEDIESVKNVRTLIDLCMANGGKA